MTIIMPIISNHVEGYDLDLDLYRESKSHLVLLRLNIW